MESKMKYHAPMVVCVIVIIALLLMPTGFEETVQYQEADRCVAQVLEIDDSAIIDTGLVRSGEQRCKVLLLDSEYEGQEVKAYVQFSLLYLQYLRYGKFWFRYI